MVEGALKGVLETRIPQARPHPARPSPRNQLTRATISTTILGVRTHVSVTASSAPQSVTLLNPTAATSHPLILTLIDIKNGLLTHFMGASTYTVEDDTESLFKVDPKEDGPDFAARIKDIVVVGLDELAALGLIKRVASGFYVLCAPLMQANQSVVISPLTAWMLADVVNHWVESTGERKETGYVVNKLAITDRDVAALCHISQTLLAAKTEPGFEDDPEDGDEDPDPERLGLPS